MCKKTLDQCHKGQEFVDFATAHGAIVDRHNGSHVIIKTDAGICPIPVRGHNGGELGTGLQCKIRKLLAAILVLIFVFGCLGSYVFVMMLES